MWHEQKKNTYNNSNCLFGRRGNFLIHDNRDKARHNAHLCHICNNIHAYKHIHTYIKTYTPTSIYTFTLISSYTPICLHSAMLLLACVGMYARCVQQHVAMKSFTRANSNRLMLLLVFCDDYCNAIFGYLFSVIFPGHSVN